MGSWFPRAQSGAARSGAILAYLLAAGSARALALTPGEVADTFESSTFIDTLPQPTDFQLLPDGRTIVTLRAGNAVVVLPDGSRFTTLITVISAHPEQGLLGIAAHPQFIENHYVYVYASIADDVQNRHQVVRYTLGDDNLLADPRVIISMGLKGLANHNGGGLHFFDGALYVSVGDTGVNATPPVNNFGTCLNRTGGKILRVDPDTGAPFPGNPLIGLGMATGCLSRHGPLELLPPDERIFAWGLRNPFKFWVDPRTSKMWIGDVGEKAREEVSIGDGGEHFGWPFFEGTIEYAQEWKPAGACQGIIPPTDCTPPAFEFPPGVNGSAVIGGRILDACDWPSGWGERYFFGDYRDNKLYAITVNDTRDGVVGSPELIANTSGLSTIRFGDDNALYVAEYAGARISRITAKGAPTTCIRVPNGEACDSSGGCASNHCVDGFCCDSDCAGTCEACGNALTGENDGHCAPVLMGTDPDGDCASECSNDEQLASHCDGAGACMEMEPSACEPDQGSGGGGGAPDGSGGSGGAPDGSPGGRAAEPGGAAGMNEPAAGGTSDEAGCGCRAASAPLRSGMLPLSVAWALLSLVKRRARRGAPRRLNQ